MTGSSLFRTSPSRSAPATTSRHRRRPTCRSECGTSPRRPALSRWRAAGGATHSPGEVVLRNAPDALRVLISAISAALRPGLRHQREDHHGVDDRRDPPRGRPHGDPQSSRGEHAGGGRHGPPRGAGGDRRLRGRRGVAAGHGGGALPRGDRARKPLPGPTRRLRGARCAGRVLGSDVVRARFGPGSSSTPTMRSSPACGGTATGAPPHHLCSSGSRIALWICRRPSTRSTRSDAAPARSRSNSISASSATWVTTAATPAAPAGPTPRSSPIASASTGSRVPASRSTGWRAGSRSTSACPGSTTSTTRWRRSPRLSRSGSTARRSPARWRRSPPSSAAASGFGPAPPTCWCS